MSGSENPCLSLAIARLQQRASPEAAEHFAIWVLKAPYPGGYVHHDCIWPETLTESWLLWQEMFKLRGLPHVPFVHHVAQNSPQLRQEPNPEASDRMPYGGRLMQRLGVSLWQWLFDGSIENSLEQSKGIAIGQNKPLRLRLEIRDPNLIPLPWEIMQPQPGQPAISLGPRILFSRTTSDVEPLPSLRNEQTLNILLVLGEDVNPQSSSAPKLNLALEADALAKILELHENFGVSVPCHVNTLLQPTPAELIDALNTENYNILFYAGHGALAPDGGLLFLRPGATLNGTELAQVLVRCRVTLAVFNACWGAQPDQNNQEAIERSSLAEVLLHHGVPAVLGMRDSIADSEALNFIKTFAQSLAMRQPIDQAVAVARQELLTLYRFNHPAWTLPVLYMHPEYDGELIKPITGSITELPTKEITAIGLSSVGQSRRLACLRSLEEPRQIWPINGGLMRVGRSNQENDLAINEQWASRKHAVIICRNCAFDGDSSKQTYFLRDFSSYGTLISSANGWQKIHHQEVPLQSGVKLKFGSMHGQTLEFIIEESESENYRFEFLKFKWAGIDRVLKIINHSKD